MTATGRPRLDPRMRFNDITPIWDAVFEHNGGTYHCTTPGLAVRTMHRMNIYRKAERERAPDGLTPFDRFTLRVSGTAVIIAPRTVMPIDQFQPPGAPPPPLNLEDC